ncbi:MAG: hypothetical protein WC260_01360 [Candidatus Pacearchaeota archaeon]
MIDKFKLRYSQPGSIRNNYYRNNDITCDFNEAYFERIVFQSHRREKYKAKDLLKEKFHSRYN